MQLICSAGLTAPKALSRAMPIVARSSANDDVEDAREESARSRKELAKKHTIVACRVVDKTALANEVAGYGKQAPGEEDNPRSIAAHVGFTDDESTLGVDLHSD